MRGRNLNILFVAMLAACTQSQSHELVDTGGQGAGYPARLALATTVPAEEAPLQPESAAWAEDGNGVTFAAPGQGALLTLSCTHDAAGAATVAITRRTRAPDGAK